ncbi:EAL domain-containing protein [Glaciihabitans sp. dw_435]|uniref:EAL domain-containing protein n=1 Tax=Glaciihabitans sp. dw_435 TaxID=2720081 RepID=UPI001BD68D13|nr:EAL domain-containing protein [Glaciihabitans sp. dw_435]
MTWDADRLAADLLGAVDRGEIVAHYQPQIELSSGDIVAAEALCRWNHPELGMVPPDTFIPIAENNGAIDGIGAFMAETACDWLGTHTMREQPIEISVNVSAIQLAEPDFYEKLATTIDASGVDPNLLTIEITESLRFDTEAVSKRLSYLLSIGVGVSIDDFGTGYASVDQLLDLPATELKIDQSLVQDTSPASSVLMTAVVSLVHRRGARVIAEGVETDEQLARVREAGFDRAQGYLFAAPMPAGEFEQLLASQRESA